MPSTSMTSDLAGDTYISKREGIQQIVPVLARQRIQHIAALMWLLPAAAAHAAGKSDTIKQSAKSSELADDHALPAGEVFGQFHGLSQEGADILIGFERRLRWECHLNQ